MKTYNRSCRKKLIILNSNSDASPFQCLPSTLFKHRIALRPRECCGLIVHNQNAAHSLIEKGLLRRVFWAYLSVPSHGIHLNLWAFPLFLGLSPRRSSRFRASSSPNVLVAVGLDSSASIDDLDFPSARWPFNRDKRICIFFIKLYRNVPARDSAPPLHVRVPPREFDGLPSAGAAPALWTGTQEPQGTDHPPMNQRKTAPIGELDL